jgi:hypothetical protein
MAITRLMVHPFPGGQDPPRWRESSTPLWLLHPYHHGHRLTSIFVCLASPALRMQQQPRNTIPHSGPQQCSRLAQQGGERAADGDLWPRGNTAHETTLLSGYGVDAWTNEKVRSDAAISDASLDERSDCRQCRPACDRD